MSNSDHNEKPPPAHIFRGVHRPAQQIPFPSSSPAFGTPVHPIQSVAPPKASILPIILPPTILRPVAIRTFTKKHGLNLNSSALLVLAIFIGRYCGTEWRESGLAEPVLETIAKNWKNRNGTVIVDGESSDLKDILKNLEGSMVGGRITPSRELSRQNSFIFNSPLSSEIDKSRTEHSGNKEEIFKNLGQPGLHFDDHDDFDNLQDPRNWLKVIDAFEQPRLIYNVGKKHFDRETKRPTLFPAASHKTQLFRNRYNLIYQRLMRNEKFQKPTFNASKSNFKRYHSDIETSQQFYKLTPINNLLGRNSTNHLILGLLTISPTETLTINDLSGSITLDLTYARPIPDDGAWFTPGMIVLVDGTYVEEDNITGAELGGGGGVGGCIGGKFIGFFVGGPPCEQRKVTLGVDITDDSRDNTVAGEFGWVDFLGVGSERAVGSQMRKIEQIVLQPSAGTEKPVGRGRIVILGEVNLDQPKTFQALRKVLSLYASEPKEDCVMAFVFMGNFVKNAIMARGGNNGSIEYKEYFDSLASILSEYPTLLQNSTFIFTPGDNDGWVSSFGAGAATVLPRRGIPDIFTSRIKRAFAMANAEVASEEGRKINGEAIWTSNPTRLSLFGPTHEIVLFRDDMTSRLRRSAILFSPSPASKNGSDDMNVKPQTSSISVEPVNSFAGDTLQSTRKLVKPLLEQGYLSPFPLNQRPVQWDYSGALQLYPLPTALVLADTDALAFVITYEGCCVMNPGRLVILGRNNIAGWVEYDVRSRKSWIREKQF